MNNGKKDNIMDLESDIRYMELKKRIEELENNNKSMIEVFKILKSILNNGIVYHNAQHRIDFNKSLEELGIYC